MAQESAPSDTESLKSQSSPPDGGYGWVCVASCCAINALTWGVVASYGVYLAYYLANDIFPGGTPSDYAFIGGLSFAAALTVAPFVSIVSSRYGSRPPMLFGAVLFGCGFIAASFASRVWHLFVTQGMLVGFGIGFMYLPSINVLPQWFERRRSLASAISQGGSGLGGLVFSLATGRMIESLSLAWALRITGIVTLVANLIAASLVRDRDVFVKPSYKLFDLQLLKNIDVILLLGWVFVMLFGYITIKFSLSAFAQSIGVTTQQADIVTAMLNLATFCVRPFVGFLSDRFGRFEVAIFMTLFTGVLCMAVWIPATSYGVAVLFALLVGGPYGVFWATNGPLCAEIVGLKRLPSMLSIVWYTAITPTLTSEFIALKLRSGTGAHAYLHPQLLAGCTYLGAGVILSLLLCRRRRAAKSTA